MTPAPLLAGIELGGTRAIAVTGGDGRIADRLDLATADPATTLAALAEWIRARMPLAAIGVASFGPLRLSPGAPDHGCILATPKRGWAGTDLLSPLRPLGLPLAIDSDVGAAALAEYRWGDATGVRSLTYVTIGTGVGAGTVIDGATITGRLHPEAGHLLLRRIPGDGFAGNCRFHGDCVEGLLSGPSLAARFGEAPAHVPKGDRRWDAPAADLAMFLCALLNAYAPQRLLVGGGVGLGAPWLLDQAIALLPALIGDYYPDLDEAALRRLISAPALGRDSGPLGALALADLALARSAAATGSADLCARET